MPTILVVGDGRLNEWTPSPRHAGNWHVTKRVDEEASLSRIGDIVWEELERDTAATIQSCIVNKNIRTGGTGADTYSVVEQLALQLQPFDRGQAAILLPCYDANQDSASLTGQLQLVDKWRSIIQQVLDKKN